MFREVPSSQFESILHLFESHKRATNLLFDWLEMKIGKIVVDSVKNPTVALFTNPPMGFVGGDSTSEFAIPLVQSIPPMTIIVPPDGGWDSLIKKEWGSKTRTQLRTRMSHENLDLEHVRVLKENLLEGYVLEKLDLSTMKSSSKSFWEPIPLFFGTFEDFLKQGFGYSIKKEELTVSVAYTAFPFSHDIEIQVMTLDDPQYRRKGLATVVCAAIIEEALTQGMAPHWDAANQVSVKLAEKLGYIDPDPYEVYYWIETRE